MNPNKALWEKGDFTQIAATMRESGEELVNTFGITNGMKVLDLACGDGNTAIPEAKAGAIVTGIDIAANLVEAGNNRIKEEAIENCTISEGDATDLHQLKDKEFDLLVSIFGAMFAPKPFDVAKEMVRVTKKGGRIIMGNWIPGDPTLVGQTLRICSSYMPAPPEGSVSPMLWGVPDHVIERFGAAGIAKENISFEKTGFTFRKDGSATSFFESFKKYYGPTMNAFEAAEKSGKVAELEAELVSLFENENKSEPKDKTYITANFLKVTVLC